MVRTLPSAATPRLEVPRILAISTVIAVHALALLVLLLPLTTSTLPNAPEPVQQPRWQIEKVIPVAPLPPEVVQPPRPATPPRPQPTPVQRITPAQPPVIADQGSLPAEPATGPVGPPDIAPPGEIEPLQGAQLRYAVAPPPSYPRDAAHAGIEGIVVLRILVDVDGRPLQVLVERSSGNRSLDREAVRHVQQRWRFEPAMRDGRAVQAWGLVPIDFSLQ